MEICKTLNSVKIYIEYVKKQDWHSLLKMGILEEGRRTSASLILGTYFELCS